MANKPKTQQIEKQLESQKRDNFFTPKYATELLIPYIPEHVKHIWESCSGSGAISKVLEENKYKVTSTDILMGKEYNVLEYDACSYDSSIDAVITNPPFSLKKKTIQHFIELETPFAFLIPADNSLWLLEAVHKFDCERIIPERRIDYITPDILLNIHKGEVVKRFYAENNIKKSSKIKYKDLPDGYKNEMLNSGYYFFHTLEQAGNELLAKYSTSQFHSFWLTRYFNIGEREIIVPLTNKQKMNIL